jgi:hypothetical protein
LDLASRTGGGHAFGALHRGGSRDTQIVGGGPQPETAGLIGIGQNRKLNVGLSGRIDVARGIVGAKGEVDMLSAQRLRNVLDINDLIDFHVKGEGVTVEDGRLQQE